MEICYNLILDPPSFMMKPEDQTVKESHKTIFHCNATGNPMPKITWVKGGKDVDAGDTLSFIADRNQSGKYWCLADNGLGLVIKASASLDVQCKLANNVIVIAFEHVNLYFVV